MTGIGEQIPEGMKTVGNACSAQDQDDFISGEALLDLNRSPPVDGGGDGQNGAPIAACIRASPVAVDLNRSAVAPDAVDLDRSPVAGAEGSQIEAPIAAGTLASPVVVDLDQYSPVAGGGASENEAPIAAGTQDSPIDVESLVEKIRSNKTGTRRRCPLIFLDLEGDTNQQGRGDARMLFCHPGGSKRRRVTPVICISPDREKRSTNQRNTLVPASRPIATAPPKEPVFTCPVCLNKLEQPSTTSCGHVFCQKCIQASIKAQKKCPTCRKKLGPRGFHRVYLPATAD